MRRFLFTSPTTFKGYVEAVYDAAGNLWRLEFSKAIGITPSWIKAYKERIPVQVQNIEPAFEGVQSVKVQEQDFEVLFEDFKREYPYKRNTHLAEAFWQNMKASEQYLAYMAAIDYRIYCTTRNLQKQYILLPEKFLKTQQWLNNWKELTNELKTKA
jgi:hypothetical protein